MRVSRLLSLVVLIAALASLPASGQVATSIVGTQVAPASAAVNPSTNTIFVANECGTDSTCEIGTNPSVTVINGKTLGTQTVTVGYWPYSVGVDTGLNQTYVATCASDNTCSSLGGVSAINGSTLGVTNIAATGYDSTWVAVNSSSHYVYVVNECDDSNCTTMGNVTAINGTTLKAVATVQAGAFPLTAVVNPVTNMIYVVNLCGSDLTCQSAGTVTVINGSTNTLVTNIAVDFYPLLAAVDQVNNKIYVTNNGGTDGSYSNGTVTVIDGASNTVEADVMVGLSPAPVVFNSKTNTAYVGNQCGSDPNCVLPPSVTVINGSNNTVTTSVPICTTETQPAYDSEANLTTNMIYFACQPRSNQLIATGLSVNVINGATNTAFPIAVGDVPNAAVVNASTNTIYVPNDADNTVSVIGGATKAQLNTVTPCRLVDTRPGSGGSGPIQGGTYEAFNLPQLAQQKCTGLNLSSAISYSLNVTLVPSSGPVGYLTIWPDSLLQPFVSTMNSDGRIKANAAIVSAGLKGAVDVYVANTANVILDIDAYFGPSGSSTLQYYPLTPCRIADTRQSNFPQGLGAPPLKAQQQRSFPLLNATTCFQQVPSGTTVAAYSLNFTAVPHGPLGYLTIWPTGQQQPNVSTLNAPTGAVTANAAIVPAGMPSGEINAYAFNDSDLIIDIDGYFAAPGSGGLSAYPTAPCRVLDTRPPNGNGPFTGTLSPPVNVLGSPCSVPSSVPAQSLGYTFNATVVPYQGGSLGYLTLWPVGGMLPVVSTLNAYDGAITSNMAIIPAGTNGEINAYAGFGATDLILDISSFYAP